MRHRVSTRLLLTVLLLGSASGCDDDEEYGLPGVGDDDGGSQHDASESDAAAGSDASVDAAEPADGGDGDGGTTDGIGPTIAVTSPAIGGMVVGDLTLRVTVTDDDGVAVGSVSATIAGTGVFEMAPVADSETEWEGTFPTTELTGLVFPTIVVRAADTGGSESQFGFSVVLDNEGPWLSLDPPRIREAKRNEDLDPGEGPLLCSQSFDPVGSDAASDGETVAQLVELRARIEDVGNNGTATSTVYVPHAGIDDARVQLYVLDDSERALIVDSDGDGTCDAINPTIVPTIVPTVGNEAAVLDLAPAPASGLSYYPAEMPDGDEFAGFNQGCAFGEDDEAPDVVCYAADNVTRIPFTPFGQLPMIYVPRPIDDNACMGYAFDAVATNIADGWACVAAIAYDNLGNHRVSPVMRICIDHDGVGGECGAGAPGAPFIAEAADRPSCTGTIDSGGTVDSDAPCGAPRTFWSSGEVGNYELLRTDL